MFRYLVSFRGVNKLVTVEDKRKLKSRCAEVFGCVGDEVAVEVFLEEYGEYADVPEPADFPDKGKIRLRVTPNHSIASASTEPAPSASDMEIR